LFLLYVSFKARRMPKSISYEKTIFRKPQHLLPESGAIFESRFFEKNIACFSCFLIIDMTFGILHFPVYTLEPLAETTQIDRVVLHNAP